MDVQFGLVGAEPPWGDGITHPIDEKRKRHENINVIRCKNSSLNTRNENILIQYQIPNQQIALHKL